jgi:predicted DNA-binding protein (MmcQ/YjbR family)
MTTSSRLTRVESALRQHAIAYPETHEDFPWGHLAVKVKGKAFLFMSSGKSEGDFLSLSVKLPVSGKVALTLPFASPTEYGLGKSGWVTARFGAKDNVPIDMLMEWVDESFRAIAPKKVLSRLEDAESDTRQRSGPKPKGKQKRREN